MENNEPQIIFTENTANSSNSNEPIGIVDGYWKNNTFLKICGWINVSAIVFLWFCVLLLSISNFFIFLMLPFFLLIYPYIFFVLSYIIFLIVRKNKVDKNDILIFKIFIGLILISVIAGFPLWKNLNKFKEPTGKERYYDMVARTFNIPEYCEKIPLNTDGGGVGLSEDDQIESLRSDCYKMVSYNFYNPNLCKKVEPVSNLFLDGSGFNEKYCLDDLKEHSTSYAGDSLSDEAIIGLLRKLGYSDEEIQYSEQDYMDDSRKILLKDKIINDLQAKEEFIRKSDNFIENNKEIDNNEEIESVLKNNNAPFNRPYSEKSKGESGGDSYNLYSSNIEQISNIGAEKSSCIDSDIEEESRGVFIKGNVIIQDRSGQTRFNDYCEDLWNLQEFGCKKASDVPAGYPLQYYEKIHCEKGCKDGSCIK